MMSTIARRNRDACQQIQGLAERDPRRAVLLARRGLQAIAANDPHIQARAEHTLGWALLCWERFADARAHLHAAQVLYDRHGQLQGSLHCRFGLLQADLLQRAHAELLPHFDALVAAFDSAGQEREVIATQLLQSILFNILGRPRDAERLLDSMTPLVAKYGGPEHARWLRVRGVAAYLQGAYARGTALLAEAEQMFVTLRMPLEVARCWYEQAAIAIRQEQFDQALRSYHRAHQVYTRYDLPFRRARCEKDAGYVLSLVGAFDHALEQTTRALHYFTAVQAVREIAGCHLHLGNIYFQTGRWEASLGCYGRAEALFAGAGIVGDQLVARRNRAMVYRALGRHAEASALLSEHEQQASLLGITAEVAESHSIQAALLADTGQTDAARARYQQARRQFMALGNAPAAAACVLDEGWLLLQHDCVDAAEAHFREAAPILHEQPHHCWRADYGLARSAELRGDTSTALAHYRTASGTVASLRQSLLSEETSSSLYVQAARLHTDALRLAASAGDSDALLALSEEQRALVFHRMLTAHPVPLPSAHQPAHDALRRQIRLLLTYPGTSLTSREAELDRALAAYGDLLVQARHSLAVEPYGETRIAEPLFDLPQVRTQLMAAYGLNWTALVYTVVGNTLSIIAVLPEALSVETVSFDAAFQHLIAQATRRAYRHYTFRDLPYLQGQTDERWTGLQALGNRLLPTSIRSRLHPGHRLLIVPAGPLHLLPWTALRLRGHWLVEQAIVQLVPSLASLQILLSRSRPSATRAFLIGCSTFGTRAPALTGIADELAAVTARLPGPHHVLCEEHASRVKLLEHSLHGDLAACTLLHIASHAQLIPARGLAAHLKLWDDDLWLPEIVGLRLGGGVVTLSACDGAAADTLPGEEVLSLSWAFLAAGASGVTASLWPVYDRAAIRTMELFYAALQQEGDAAVALASAQRGLIQASRRGDDPVAEPRCWASFVAVGAGRLSG